MSDSPKSAGSQQPLLQHQGFAPLCDEFERRFQEGLAANTELPRIEDYLNRVAPADHESVLRELLRVEIKLRRAAGLSVNSDIFRQRFGPYRMVIESIVETASVAAPGKPRTTVVGSDAAEFATAVPTMTADELGELSPLIDRRYQIQKKLGRGGFADVYLARDTQLDRRVALKVPRRDRLDTITDGNQRAAVLQLFADEARKSAQLDHPAIVRVYDVLRSANTMCIVQEYVDGVDLGTHVRKSRLTPRQCAELLIATADALGHAHRQGFVHRDVKPQNILVDTRGQPHVADFGLSLHESAQRKHAGELAGTYPYMSPEQVRREVHRLDGRSDLWSLGVILYQLLTGRRPFDGESIDELLDEILTRDPKPLRQIEPQVPNELARICLACLAKRATDRYQSAADLIDDLRNWLDVSSEKGAVGSTTSMSQPTSAAAATMIVPKGLRSYDASDASFFLELLPGPHDRDGLPKCVRFWKTRLEERDPDATFSVGLMYGPSGCGKSSLVKAALLPHLSGDVVSIYVEATPADTEVRLLKSLKKRCPELATDASLRDLLAQLRDNGGSRGRKVVLILDQFEQSLHAHTGRDDSQLILALRQCDGAHVQALVLVRDDFWMSATRFMQALEVPLVEGHNSAAVDLFDLPHAGKVLAMFGRGYGKLPAPPAEPTADQQNFLTQAVCDIAEDGKVVCVRLAVFAEMMKGRPWTTASLREVGGATGVGVSFLEETFSSKTAAPAHRLHQQAARAVLKNLLPEQGTEIKGQMRSYDELLDAADYRDRRPDFDALLRILDRELRLITPTEPDGTTAGAGASVITAQGRFYQLTHDYLVPSLRDWLTRKQRETRRGRAELRLTERAAAWNGKPENRYLPSLWEFINIRALTNSQRWTDSQRAMMARATSFHGIRSALGTVTLVALLTVGMVVRINVTRQQETTRIRGLVGELTNAEPAQVPGIASRLAENPDVAATILSSLLSTDGVTPDDRRAKLHARMATVARDPSLVEPLVEELLTGKATYVMPIRQLLRPNSSKLTDRFRSLLRDEKAEPKRRFHAALALADYVPESDSNSWTDQNLRFVTQQLVSENAEFQPLLRDALRPIRGKLLTDLERIFGDPRATDAQRLSAANAFADYSASDVAKLSQLLTVATPEQYAVVYPLVAANPVPSTIEALGQIAAKLPPTDLGSVARVPYGQRRANAAVTLLRLGEREKALPVFELTDDPEALTQFVFRCRPRGVGVEPLLDCLRLVNDAPKDRYPKNTRFALLLALGEFSLAEVPAARREALLMQLADWYADDPSSGVHGAAGSLLRHWGQTELVRKVDETPLSYSPEREWFTLAITVTPTAPAHKANPEPSAQPLSPQTFYYTFIVFPPGDYSVGSAKDETDRSPEAVRERRHTVQLTRPFALLDREVTFEELIAFSPLYPRFLQQSNAQPTDAGTGISWYDSVRFCRWLGQQSGLAESDQAYAAPESLDREKYPREPDTSASWAPQNWPLDLRRRGFRLPTEAEWEVAARGGARTRYGYGSEASLLGRFAWYWENSRQLLHPPKARLPNMRGLFDLHGNVQEWTHDWFDVFDTVPDPVGPPKGSSRVYRGGCWGNGAAECRSSSRGSSAPPFRAMSLGLRLALSPSVFSSPAEQAQGKGAEPAGGGTKERSGAATAVPLR